MIVRKRCMPWFTKLNVFNQTSKRKYVNFIDYPFEEELSKKHRKEILSRVTIVDNEKQSKQILLSLIQKGDPVGVDVEGTHLPFLSQVQMKVQDGSVFIFPVRSVPGIVDEGHLKAFLENPRILKVMVGAAGDLRAFYRDSIKLWGLFDLDLAYKVMKYQNLAENIHCPPVGLSTICNEFGLEANPFKKFNEGTSYKYDGKSSQPSEAMILYSTLDVEPLLELYHILIDSISEDFLYLLKELNEIDLIRCVDPELAKTRKAHLKRNDFSKVYVKNLKHNLSKPELYMSLAHFDGSRLVQLGLENTAHIQFYNRQQALVAQKFLAESEVAKKTLGENIEANLLIELRHSEVEGIYLRGADRSQQNNKLSLVNENVRGMIETILQVKSPVVIDLQEMEGRSYLEIFVGRFPSLKFEVTPENVMENGVAELIGSTDVVKILKSINSKSFYSLFRSCTALNFRPQNFFVVSSACLLNDYLRFGTSAFEVSESSSMELGRSLGIFSTSNLENLLYAYLHLSNELPSAAQDMLIAKTRAELDIASNVFVSEAKEARRQLKMKFESQALHITAVQKSVPPMQTSKFEASLKETLLSYTESMNYEVSSYLGYQNYAIIGLTHHTDTVFLLKDIKHETFFDQRFELKASKIGNKTGLRNKSPKKISTLDLDRSLLANIENLHNLEFFQRVQHLTEKKNFEPLKDRDPRNSLLPKINLKDII